MHATKEHQLKKTDPETADPLNDCCKKAVERYQREEEKRKKSLEVLRGTVVICAVTILLTVDLIVTWNGQWRISTVALSVFAAVGWWVIVTAALRSFRLKFRNRSQ